MSYMIMVSQYFVLLSQNYDIIIESELWDTSVSQQFDLLSHSFHIVSKTSDLASQYFDLLSQQIYIFYFYHV